MAQTAGGAQWTEDEGSVRVALHVLLQFRDDGGELVLDDSGLAGAIPLVDNGGELVLDDAATGGLTITAAAGHILAR